MRAYSARKYVMRTLTSSLVGMLIGCAANYSAYSSDLDLEIKQLRLTSSEWRPVNHASSTYGCGERDDGRWGNEVFAFDFSFLPVGFRAEMENLTEAPIVLNWEKCMLVDSEGWTHNILHPELFEEEKGNANPAIQVAPYAKRVILLIPRVWSRHQVNRPGERRAFHPMASEVTRDGFTERLILSLDYDGEVLIYDIELQYRPIEEHREERASG